MTLFQENPLTFSYAVEICVYGAGNIEQAKATAEAAIELIDGHRYDDGTGTTIGSAICFTGGLEITS